MKFDLIIGNPPYNGGLDLRIHKVMQNQVTPSGKIVFVHPAMFLLSHKYNVNKRAGYDLDTSKFESVHIFDGNDLFNIGLAVAVAITIWDNGKTNNIVNVRDDAYTNTSYICRHDEVHIYGEKYRDIKKWLDTYVDYVTNGSVGSHGKYKPTSNIYVAFPFGYGGGPMIIPKSKDSLNGYLTKAIGYTSNHNNVFSFSNEVERTNFLNYLKTKSVRFILSLSKTNQALFRGELNQIPWMNFTKSYSDKTLRDIWNIDDELWKFIDKSIPDIYSDYHYDGFYQNS